MKSKNLLLLLVATSSLGLSSCGHTHEYQTEFVKDETNHWHECTCGEKSGITEHNFNIPGEITLAQTHTEDGTQIYSCECGATTTVTIPKDGHSHSETWSNDETTHWHECACGDKKDVSAHEYNIPGEVLEEPTHYKDGTQLYTCVCGKETTIVLPKGEHDHSTWGSNDEQHWKECDCGDKIEITNHEFNIEGEVITPNTCTTDGEQKYLCVCGKETTIVLKAKGHVDENKDITCDVPGCGTRVLPPNNSTIDGTMANLIGMTISSSNKYYVIGKVINLEDAKNGVFYIDDGTDPIFVRLPYIEGVQYSKAGVRVCEGDTVQMYGKLSKYASQTATVAAFTGTETNLTILEHEHTYGEATCTEPAQCPCLDTTGEPNGHIDRNNDNLCDECSLNLLLQESKLVFNTLDTSPYAGVLDTVNYTHTFENDDVKFVLSKGTSSAIDTSKNEHIRLRNGNQVVFESKTDKLIDSMVLTSTSTTYADKIVTAYSAVSGATVTKTDAVVTITFENPVSSVTTKFTASSRIVSASIYLVK